MRLFQRILLGVAAISAAGWLSSSLVAGPQNGAMPMKQPMSMSGMQTKSMTKEQKIANAMSAAPQAVSGNATILDWPSTEGEKPAVIRTGKNGWNCLPDMPQTEGNDPMCLDASWMKWVDAYLSHTAPKITQVGVGYMMAPGGAMGSNTDPYAMKMTSTNHWGHHAPHMMILVPDVKTLGGLSSDPGNGGPYVMFKDTPYAHIMAPVAASSMDGMKSMNGSMK
jgi:hypothetical protein